MLNIDLLVPPSLRKEIMDREWKAETENEDLRKRCHLVDVDMLLAEKVHTVYRDNGEPYDVITVQDLKEAMRDDECSRNTRRTPKGNG